MIELFPVDITPFLGLIVFAILGLVQFVKTFGLEGRILTLVSFLIGAAYAAAIYLLPVDTVKIVVGVSLFGLAACGVYDFGNLIGAGLGKVLAGVNAKRE